MRDNPLTMRRVLAFGAVFNFGAVAMLLFPEALEGLTGFRPRAPRTTA